MKYTVQILYPQFVEIFDVDLQEDKLDIQLGQVVHEPSKKKGIVTLDLSGDLKDSYSLFPFEDGDLAIIQIRNKYVVVDAKGGQIKWFRFSSSELLEYLFNHNVTARIFPYMKEDKEILLNSLLSDISRNDYSYNPLNRKIKHLKLSLLLSFIKDNITTEYKRLIFDETVLGDIEIDEVPLSLRFAGCNFTRATKINNVMKVLIALNKAKKIKQRPRFIDELFFVNNPNNGEKVKLIFGESGIKFDYQVMPQKNYIFELGDKDYSVNIGNTIREIVRGKVYVYNGDERDLMIKE
jgi:hypothetical protein